MGSLARVLIALTVACAMVFVGTGVALAAAVASTGVVTVDVREEGPSGTRLLVPVPALVLDLGLDVAQLAVPRDELARIRVPSAALRAGEVRPFAPGITELARELERCPDATLVEVTSDRESVRVTKRGHTFVVDVDGPEGQVRVVLPARTLTRVARFLEG